MAAAAKKNQLMAKFTELDVDGDGSLDIDELRVLLQKGNPSITEDEVMKLYKAADINGDGRIQFEEFLQYIYKGDHGSNRTTEGRHARAAAASGPCNDGSETDWGPIQDTFKAYAGKDMDGKEFMKFCKDAHMVGHGMTKMDVDIIFTKVVPKGKRRMEFAHFQDSCRLIAAKRGQPNGQIQEMVQKVSGGPVLSGTKTEHSRFHDDKSTYTGAHTNNDKIDGVDPNHGQGRHERMAASTEAALHGGQEEDDWAATEATFDKFAGPERKLDGKEFGKFCFECGLIGHGMHKTDTDVVFAGVARKERQMNFDMFKDCVRKIAQKRSEAVYVVQDKIANSKGPVIHATKTEYSRFHDDKSTYTGAHVDVHGGGTSHGEDRHARLAADAAETAAGDEGERAWDQVERVSKLFAESAEGLSGKEFIKMLGDVDMFDSKFDRTSADIIFTSAAGRGQRHLGIEQLMVACRSIAKKKGCPIHQVQNILEESKGPILHGTKTDAVRFYDDKDTFTGTFAQ